MILDPHGFLYEDVLAYASAHGYRDRIITIDPNETGFSVGINFLENKWMDDAALVCRDVVAKEGYEMVEYNLPPDELDRWIATAEPFWEAWVKKTEAAGHPEAREILDTVLGLIDTEPVNKAETPDIGSYVSK